MFCQLVFAATLTLLGVCAAVYSPALSSLMSPQDYALIFNSEGSGGYDEPRMAVSSFSSEVVVAAAAPKATSPRPPLTRLGNYGEEFYDHWAPLDGDVDPELRRRLFNAMGTDDQVDELTCTPVNSAAAVQRLPIVATRLMLSGLGSNLLMLSNYIMHLAITQQYKLMFLAFRAKDNTNHPEFATSQLFQNWYEEHFALPNTPGTTCDIHQVCANVPEWCPDAYWGDGSKAYDFRLRWDALGTMKYWRPLNLEQHNRIQTLLFREVMRLQPEAKRVLDAKHQTVLQAFKPSVFDKQITMHVRRTDKLLIEAKLVNCTVFAEALEMVVLKPEFQEQQQQRVLLHIVTDDAAVLDEFNAAWQARATSEMMARVTVNFRFSGGEPPHRLPPSEVSNSFFQLLVDFRLMIAADAFIGSQSSNMGVVACMLRNKIHCYTVEQPRPFHWDTNVDKYY